MPSTEQLDLAQRLLGNEEQVLDDILRSLGPAICTVLRKRYANVLTCADIDDAMSIGLYRLWQHRQRFDSQRSSLKVWLFRIVENAVRDILRLGWHKARRMEVGGDPAWMAEAFETPTDHPSTYEPQSHGNEQQTAAPVRAPSAVELQLREIVACLPEAQRKIVQADAAARDDTACSQRLAEELGVTASSVRVYRKRAMDRIRQELRNRGHDVP